MSTFAATTVAVSTFAGMDFVGVAANCCCRAGEVVACCATCWKCDGGGSCECTVVGAADPGMQTYADRHIRAEERA